MFYADMLFCWGPHNFLSLSEQSDLWRYINALRRDPRIHVLRSDVSTFPENENL